MFSRFPEGLSLRIGCWNINGFNSKSLGNKFQQSEVLGIINKHDIFGIVETHVDSNSDLQIHDFRLGTMLNIERTARENVTQAVLPYT